MCREKITTSNTGGRVVVGYARTAEPSARRAAYWRAKITEWCTHHGHHLAVTPVDQGAPGIRRPAPALAAVLDIVELPAVALVVVPSLYHLSWSPGALDHLHRQLSLYATVVPLAGPPITDIRQRAKGAARWGSA